MAPSTSRPRRTRRTPARATAASSTSPSTPGSATRPTPTSSATWPRTKLGCTVNYKDLKEDVSWQGFGTGDVDVVIEDWGHPDLEKKFFEGDGDGSAEDLGPTGNVGIIDWYVPPWLAKEYPDILDYKNLNKYADQFKTSESGGKGQFLGADPSYVQFDEAIVSNLKLDFKVVFSGSRGRQHPGLREGREEQGVADRLLLRAAVALRGGTRSRRSKLPPYKEGCQDDPAKVACDYPETTLKKIASTKWVEEGWPGRRPGQELQVDQRRPERGRASTSPRTACRPRTPPQKWIEDNPDKVDAWLG